ncbi:MAG: DUF1622 domain-containing protein [Cyanobacteria bacterium J06638_22]
MEWMESVETSLGHLVAIAQLCLESVSLFCVVMGLLRAAKLALKLTRQKQARGISPFNYLRLRFGMWLALALEFQLGADILGTTLDPSIDELVKLAIIALIRTFLNYFLGRELEKELEMEKMRGQLAEDAA